MNKSILVNGTFRSGSGAINDYLSSRTDFCNPFGENEFRLVSDAIDVLDARICNLRIVYEVYLDKMVNKQMTLLNINSRIADAFQLKYFQIDQPLIIDDVINVILNSECIFINHHIYFYIE